jgi:hypothetical protein
MPSSELRLPERHTHRCPTCASERTGPAEHVIVSDGVIVREERLHQHANYCLSLIA